MQGDELDVATHVLKIVVVGDAGVGKTSLIKRYVHNHFDDKQKASVGVDFHVKQMMVGDAQARLQLWDIAGQEHFGSAVRVYYKDAVGVLLVYDISRPSTFETVLKWKDELNRRVVLSNGEPAPVVLLGNKADLDSADVDQDKLQSFCAKHGIVASFDTSAKTGKGIDKAARCLVDAIMKHEDVFKARAAERDLFQPGLGKRKQASAWWCGGCV
jgi:small GTP-binding protein